MTTRVTVTAMCDEKTEVVVEEENNYGYQISVLQDGDSQDFHVHDDRMISVFERAKE